MINLIETIFYEYDFIKVDNLDDTNIRFYKKNDPKIASYFLTYTMDCTEIEDYEAKMKEMLQELEKMYSSQEESLRHKLQNSCQTDDEAAQLDKNTSAIYLLKFTTLEKMTTFRNLIYATEESANYFKRYVLPYTQNQITEVNNLIHTKGKKISQVLNEIIENEAEYYNLLKNRNSDSVYSLTVRLFSKIPFLQYHFKTVSSPISIEEAIKNETLREKNNQYHDLAISRTITAENIWELLPQTNYADEDIESEMDKLLEVEVPNGF